MKKIIIILLFSNSVLNAATYYVAPSGGSDSNPGTIAQPFATWQKGFDTAEAGDTVYFRNGIWQPTSEPILNPSASHGNNGTYTDPICFFNYPNETPILDCSNYTSEETKVALDVKNVTYIKFRGLTVRNCEQIVLGQWISGISLYQVGVIWFDQMVSHDIEGYGTWIIGFDTLYVTNCDSYNNISENDPEPGNRADGFTFGSGTAEPDSTNLFIVSGCRSWNNSDDGFEVSPACQSHVYNNWAFSNGLLEYGAGVGFKYSHGYKQSLETRKAYNNIAAFNKASGFVEQNLNYPYGPIMHYYNNIAYKCKQGFTTDPGTGFDCDIHDAEVLYQNNVVYNSWGLWYWELYLSACDGPPSYARGDHNTWLFTNGEIPYWEYNDTLSWAYSGLNDNFNILDSASMFAELTASRKADGSLPDITFLTLKEGSVLIDAGVDVGLPYNGLAPDLGYSEYGSADSTATNILTFTLSAQTGSATINSTAHTVSIEVEYGTSVTALQPTITVSEGATISPTSGTATDFTSLVVYTVTALDESTQEWTVTVTVAAAPETPTGGFMGSGGQFMKSEGKFMKGGNSFMVYMSAPVATAATSVTDTSFTANWTAVSGASSYRLDVSTASNFATFVTGYNNLTVSGTSQSVTGLTENTTYYYRVRAVNSAGVSASSNIITVAVNIYVFVADTFNFTTNEWIDATFYENNAALKNASARTSITGNLDYTITGVLTTDSISVVDGSDLPTIPVDGTLRIAEGDTVYGISIWREDVIWAIIPFCEPIIETNIPTTSYDVSGNSHHALCSGLAEANVATQNNYFYLAQYGYNDTKVKYQSDFSTSTSGWSAVWGTSGTGTLSFSNNNLTAEVTKQPTASATTRPYLQRNNTITSGIYTRLTIIGTALYAGYNAGGGLITVAPWDLVNRSHVANFTAGETTLYLYFNGSARSSFEINSVLVEEYYIIPGLLAGTNDVLGKPLRNVQDGSTWLRYACDIDFPFTLEKPKLSTLLLSGYCVADKNYFIENTTEGYFGEYTENQIFTATGDESLSEANSVREVLDTIFVGDPLKFTDFDNWRPHLYYNKMDSNYYDGGYNYRTTGYIKDLIIFKDDVYVSDSDHAQYNTDYVLIQNVDFPLVVFSWDHTTPTEIPLLDTVFVPHSVPQTFFINYGHYLTNTQIKSLIKNDNEIGLHTLSINGEYPPERIEFHETSANYTTEQLATYYEKAVNYYDTAIDYRIVSKAYPGGAADDVTFSAVLDYFNIGRSVSATLVTNNRLKIPINRWDLFYAQGFDIPNQTTIEGHIDAIITTKRTTLGIYGHPGTWDLEEYEYYTILENILDYIRTKQVAGDEIRVVTYKQLYDLVNQYK
jgi:hypothetical protein